MTPEQKESELQRHRAILLATLDYLEERFGRSIAFDQYDPAMEYYQQQKIQTEKYFKQRRLDRLQQRLASLTKGMQNAIDLAFTSFIKERTGYDLDIFEGLRKRVEAIIEQNEIRSQKELNDIGTMLRYLHETATGAKKVEKLKWLLTDYSKRKSGTSGKRKGVYSEVVSIVEEDGLEQVTVKISFGLKSKYFKEQEAISPDGKRRLRVVQSGERNNASTYVAIEFPTASGAVYGLRGIFPDVKAWWKDNSTIVIETKKEYTAHAQNREVRSFGDVISIEYIES